MKKSNTSIINENEYKKKLLVIFAISPFLIITAYAWGSIWHDVNLWKSVGTVVTNKELAENLEYLYNRISSNLECGKGALMKYNQSLDKFECFRCPVGSAIQWQNGQPTCVK